MLTGYWSQKNSVAPQGLVTAGSCHYPRAAGKGEGAFTVSAGWVSTVWRGLPNKSVGLRKECRQAMVTHVKGAKQDRHLDPSLLAPSDFLLLFPHWPSPTWSQRARKSTDTAPYRSASQPPCLRAGTNQGYPQAPNILPSWPMPAHCHASFEFPPNKSTRRYLRFFVTLASWFHFIIFSSFLSPPLVFQLTQIAPG